MDVRNEFAIGGAGVRIAMSFLSSGLQGIGDEAFGNNTGSGSSATLPRQHGLSATGKTYEMCLARNLKREQFQLLLRSTLRELNHLPACTIYSTDCLLSFGNSRRLAKIQYEEK